MKKNSTVHENDIKPGQIRWINMQISVIDTGVGISQENLPKLFVEFGKLDEHS